MRILIWASTFQAELQALAADLGGLDDVELLVVAPSPQSYLASPVASVLPAPHHFLDRDAPETMSRAASFNADVIVVDNNVPRTKLAPRLFMAWHGFGWRADDITATCGRISSLYGSVAEPNLSVRWLALGPTDAHNRSANGVHEDNIVQVGSSFGSWLQPRSPESARVTTSWAQQHYSIDLSLPTALFAFTWHYLEPLSSWGDTSSQLDQLFGSLEDRDINALVRLHDQRRYRRSFVRSVQQMSDRFPNVQVKFRNANPDSLVDMLVSDVMVSDLSSILTYWYHSEKRSIHLPPRADGRGRLVTRRLRHRRLASDRTPAAQAEWKVSPDDVGGPSAQSLEQLVDQLADGGQPVMESEQRADFVSRHLKPPERGSVAREIVHFVHTG